MGRACSVSLRHSPEPRLQSEIQFFSYFVVLCDIARRLLCGPQYHAAPPSAKGQGFVVKKQCLYLNLTP